MLEVVTYLVLHKKCFEVDTEKFEEGKELIQIEVGMEQNQFGEGTEIQLAEGMGIQLEEGTEIHLEEGKAVADKLVEDTAQHFPA